MSGNPLIPSFTMGGYDGGELPAEKSTEKAEERILRAVTVEEMNLIREVLAGVKNRGDGWGEIVITLKRGRITQCTDSGKQIPRIYGDEE